MLHQPLPGPGQGSMPSPTLRNPDVQKLMDVYLVSVEEAAAAYKQTDRNVEAAANLLANSARPAVAGKHITLLKGPNGFGMRLSPEGAVTSVTKDGSSPIQLPWLVGRHIIAVNGHATSTKSDIQKVLADTSKCPSPSVTFTFSDVEAAPNRPAVQELASSPGGGQPLQIFEPIQQGQGINVRHSLCFTRVCCAPRFLQPLTTCVLLSRAPPAL